MTSIFNEHAQLRGGGGGQRSTFCPSESALAKLCGCPHDKRGVQGPLTRRHLKP